MILMDNVGIAGTVESSDIAIRIEPNEGKGIEIILKSTVENQYGAQIKKVIRERLEELGIKDAIVHANDKGALDCTIKARVTAAANRALQSARLPWEGK